MADMFTEALQKSKAIDRMMDSFINKDQTAQDSLQLDELEKGKAGQLGEIRTWGGKKYQKTPKGWRPVKTGAHDGGSKEKFSESEGSFDNFKSAPVGSVVTVVNKQTGNVNVTYTKRQDGWYGKDSMRRSEYKVNSISDVLKKYGNAWNIKTDLKKESDSKDAGVSGKSSDGWKEGFGGDVIWKEYSDSDFKVVEIKKDDKDKYHLNIGGYKAPNAITESEAVEKKISEIRSQSYDSLDEAKMMADVVSRMKYSDIVKESKISKEENNLSATKTWISKYEEKISAEIKKLQERLETAKKQAETTAKVEAAIPDVFKKAGLNFKSATLILNEDNPERQYFNVEAGIPGRFMVKGAHGSNSANDKAYENALAKAAVLSSVVESFFEEKGLTVKARINPYSLQYKDSSEKNNSTAEIDLKISNYGE